MQTAQKTHELADQEPRMVRAQILKKIETDYWEQYRAQSKFGLSLWPLIRVAIYIKLLELNEKKQYFEKKSVTNKVASELCNFSWLPRIRNIFSRKYKFLFFSDSSERKKIKNKMYHRLMDPVMDYLGQDNCLMIERQGRGAVWKEAHTRNLVPGLLLELSKFPIYIVLSVYFKLKKNVFIRSDLVGDLNRKLVGFFSSFYFYKIWFYISKPKAVFLTDSYGRYDLIRAAKEMGCIVVELQHGIINYPHIGYHGEHGLESGFCPDYMLVFGPYDKKTLRNSKLLVGTQALVVGSYYIDYVNSTAKKAQSDNIRNCRTVVVTMQEALQTEIIEFITKTAILNKNIEYMLIPRVNNANYNIPPGVDNVVINNNGVQDAYQCIALSDVHVTSYSTCGYESPSLGVPTVFLDIQDFPNQYFKELLGISKWHAIAHNPRELEEKILEFVKNKPKRDAVDNDYLIPDGFNYRLVAALRDINLTG